MSQATRWRSLLAIAVVVGGVAAATYPIIVAPYMNPDPWKKRQKFAREGVDRDKMQPGGMKVWSDPFERK